MKVFIVAVPLFDANMVVQAYRLCDRSGETTIRLHTGDFRHMSESLRSPGLELVEQIGVEPFAVDKPLLADVNTLQLLTGFPTDVAINPGKLVCTLPGNTIPDAAVLNRCKTLQEQGYQLALDGFPPEGLISRLLPLVDYVILSYRDKYFDTWYRLSKRLGRIRTVVSDVPDRDIFDRLGSGSDALFTGSFYNQPITEGVVELSPVKITALQLLNMVNTADFELQDIARIIERDPYLTISLLRFINRGGRLRNRVDSIISAVAILGQREVRRWATVAISVNLANDRPGEITKLSLVRAKFAENLATAFGLGVFQPNLFMTGLFSLIDIILEKPMPEAIAEIAVDKRVREALASRTGDLAEVMEFIYSYERADWDAVSFTLIRKNIPVEVLNAAFVDAMIWYHELLSSIDESEPPSVQHGDLPEPMPDQAAVTQPSKPTGTLRANQYEAPAAPPIQPYRPNGQQPQRGYQPGAEQYEQPSAKPTVQPYRPSGQRGQGLGTDQYERPSARPTVQPYRPSDQQQRGYQPGADQYEQPATRPTVQPYRPIGQQQSQRGYQPGADQYEQPSAKSTVQPYEPDADKQELLRANPPPSQTYRSLSQQSNRQSYQPSAHQYGQPNTKAPSHPPYPPQQQQPARQVYRQPVQQYDQPDAKSTVPPYIPHSQQTSQQEYRPDMQQDFNSVAQQPYIQSGQQPYNSDAQQSALPIYRPGSVQSGQPAYSADTQNQEQIQYPYDIQQSARQPERPTRSNWGQTPNKR